MQIHDHDHDASDGSTPSTERVCSLCGDAFAITSAEQAFRQDHRLGQPDLCPECRAQQRAGRNAEIIALYKKASTVDTALTTVSPSRHGGRSNVRGQMYATVCDACGSETRVPFVPRGDRPVYCRDCYNARRGR